MAKGQRKIGQDIDPIIAEMPRACSDELVAVEFMEHQRWGDHPCCPHCGADGVYKMTKRGTDERNARFLWRCRDCGKQYTVRVGTVLEDSAIPLRHWCFAFWKACTCKNGVAALEIKRQTGLSYKSALFMMHRIRYAMTAPSRDGLLDGVVEADETFVGGKAGNKIGRYGRAPHMGAYSPIRQGRPKKAPVMVMIQRGGEARASTIPSVTAENLRKAIKENVAPTATLATDEGRGYVPLGREQEGGHLTVNHSQRQYVDDLAYTNTAESFFSGLKRSINGTYIHVSKRHLHRYVAQSEFLWNTRKQTDGERIVRAILGAEGKRLIYRSID